ncbi:MAG: universal stress protein [Reichenbachiella sp.]
MNIINNILVPVDFSLSADNAINYVIALSRSDRKIRFTLLHSVESDANVEDAKKKLEEIKATHFDNEHIGCETIVLTGSLHKCVNQVLTEFKIDMIVMGTAGEVDQHHPTKTAELICQVDIPVWVIPQNITNFKLKNIALALDEKELDNASDLQVFHDIAKWYNAKVHLLKVDPENKERKKMDLRKEYTLEYYLDNLDYHYSFPKNSDIEAGICDYMNDNDVDALAIICRLHAKKTEPSEGRLTKALASHTKVPLLVLD